MNQESKSQLPRQTNYETSLAMAKEKLRALEFERQCRNGGLEIEGPAAEVPFLDRRYRLDQNTLELSPADNGPPPELWEKIIILHYLITAAGVLPTHELISYQQVPDGAPYSQNFLKRTAGILLPLFGNRPQDLLRAAEKLGAKTVRGYGDLAFTLPALPRVQYLFVFHSGDAEFPPDIKILFDAAITGYLPAEDITVLAQMICRELARLGKI
jgi:hypothetical protein